MNAKTLTIILGVVAVVLIGWLVYSQGWLNKPVDNVANNQIVNNAIDNQISSNPTNQQVANNTTEISNETKSKVYTNRQIGITFNYLNIDGDATVESYSKFTSIPNYWLDVHLLGYKSVGADGPEGVWLNNPANLMVGNLVIYHGGDLNTYGGPKEELDMAVFNAAWDVFRTNMAGDYRFTEKSIQSDRGTVITQSGVLRTSNTLRYFTLKRTHKSDSWVSVTYVIELGNKTVVLNTSGSTQTEFTRSILNSIKTI